ncbi:hypothetical protein NHX12_006083 [Muraenolepis orangiensis]|uniref:Uncharacterized protein n=1 Tax=Muraenolepis orangiensis TaxID=630683 RepID=A0A9Q0DQE2_9TELE|nr:hypothetical protein NHX12_006083 [Muraenolepis orangiensis]
MGSGGPVAPLGPFTPYRTVTSTSHQTGRGIFKMRFALKQEMGADQKKSRAKSVKCILSMALNGPRVVDQVNQPACDRSGEPARVLSISVLAGAAKPVRPTENQLLLGMRENHQPRGGEPSTERRRTINREEENHQPGGGETTNRGAVSEVTSA